jgi:hypothetical protein
MELCLFDCIHCRLCIPFLALFFDDRSLSQGIFLLLLFFLYTNSISLSTCIPYSLLQEWIGYNKLSLICSAVEAISRGPLLCDDLSYKKASTVEQICLCESSSQFAAEKHSDQTFFGPRTHLLGVEQILFLLQTMLVCLLLLSSHLSAKPFDRHLPERFLVRIRVMSCEHTDRNDHEEPGRVLEAQKKRYEHHVRCEEKDKGDDHGGCDDEPETDEDCPYDQTD